MRDPITDEKGWRVRVVIENNLEHRGAARASTHSFSFWGDSAKTGSRRLVRRGRIEHDQRAIGKHQDFSGAHRQYRVDVRVADGEYRRL